MAKESSAGVKVARGVLYVFACVMAVVVVVALVITAYYTAENTANVSMIAKDAFAKRAEMVLLPSGDADEAEADQAILQRLFTDYAIATDEMLNGGHYEHFNVSNYYENADVEFSIIWPWKNEATVRVTEKVLDIAGRPKAAAEGETAAVSETPPDWSNGVYEVYFVKDPDSGSWKINGMKLVEPIVIPRETASAPPSASVSATPAQSAVTEQSVEPEPTTTPEAEEVNPEEP